jgi:hypothetical protein
MDVKTNDIDFLLKGKTQDEQDFILQGISHLGNTQNFILPGVVGIDDDLDFILAGKPYDEQAFILQSRNQDELGFILKTIDEATKKRLALFDTLNLRTTAVYRAPRDISYLKLIYGDFSNSRIPCTPLDKDGYIHHASDIPMQTISKIFIDGEPKTFGFKAYPAYQDETGHSIACVIFDNPQYDKKVSISGKGAINIDIVTASAGDLIENPADLIRDILLNIQGYDESSIDLAEISRFYSDCLTEEITIACIITEPVSIKTFFDELAMNIHAHWMISDGKSVMRLKWL